jgi:hypothetical protein
MAEAKDDLVYLLVGEHDEADGEVMSRSDMPSDAYQAPLTVKLSSVIDGALQGDDQSIDVWVVAR